MVAKSPESDEDKVSFNKWMRRVVEIAEPIVTNSNFWKIVQVAQTPLKSELPVSAEVGSRKILTSSSLEEKNDQLEGEKESSSIFATGFTGPYTQHPQHGGPRSVTVLSMIDQNQNTRVIEAHDGFKAKNIQNAASQPLDNSWNYIDIRGELEIESGRKTVQLQIANKMYTIKNPYGLNAYELGDQLATQLYDSIRTCETDVCDIASNLGFRADNIKNVKDHGFYNKHQLHQYASLGEKTEYKRFDPNIQQALAWKRLEAGTHTKDDLTWLKHECAERHHELKYGAGYSESHARAQSRFDGSPWENDWENNSVKFKFTTN